MTISIYLSNNGETLLDKNVKTGPNRRRSVGNKEYRVEFSFQEDLSISYTVIQLPDKSVIKSGTGKLEDWGKKRHALRIELNE